MTMLKKSLKRSLPTFLSGFSKWDGYQVRLKRARSPGRSRVEKTFNFTLIMVRKPSIFIYTSKFRWGIFWTVELWSCRMLFSCTSSRRRTWLFRTWIWSSWATSWIIASWSPKWYCSQFSNQIWSWNFPRQKNMERKSYHSKTLLPWSRQQVIYITDTICKSVCPYVRGSGIPVTLHNFVGQDI